MRSQSFERLFSPLTIRGHVIRNRVLSSGHQTYLAEQNLPGPRMIAYHEARARGGAGLIITESARFHSSSTSDSLDLVIQNDDAIPHFSSLAEAVHRHGARIIGQLSHSGRVTRRMAQGMRGVVFAPSPVPDHRFHTLPREMPTDMVAEVIAAAAAGARRYAQAGYDGVELMASHGLLFAQFLNPHSNLRSDIYGGSFENRLRPLREALILVRQEIGPEHIVGLRISAAEDELSGLEEGDVINICKSLAAEGLIDYVNTTFGSMAALGASVHVVPPMEIEAAYLASKSHAIKAAIPVPVFLAGRINQPQVAEAVLAEGQADMCAMTRAMITDPDMANKARAGAADDIRACIGCNQACIGHFHAGNPISCIQNPVSGRETLFPVKPVKAPASKRVLVIGGGPAGMKAALTAAELGHDVTLAEAGPQLGGQALLAQLLPERAEFGGLITNLQTELARHEIRIQLNRQIDAAALTDIAPEAVILATGASPYLPPVEGADAADMIELPDLLKGTASPGNRVVIADWRCDWQGIGAAVKLRREGHHVRLAVDGICAGQNLQQYVRDYWAGKLHELEIEVIPYARLYGADTDSAYFLHTASNQPIILEAVDSLVLATGRSPRLELEPVLQAASLPFITIGDCATPRSAEEAIYEGLAEVAEFLGS
ncbi:FAD-dependent oxidoreductase [Pseudogemmobacter faecipullorum]|uniref:FAD-dependent oxidoreductase n=1 Tax=Pseudogemmobacter faecipullorum TaxID=2755041 RepID=A0ABS8CRC4_9RHOB|nr:FAD-dependent oxidoreductase [Pseudogemmobacter faecipullorum]MCB5411956.1 FAD-dependent oxidoreductase [Pseudogemmobacter faecipullorum]